MTFEELVPDAIGWVRVDLRNTVQDTQVNGLDQNGLANLASAKHEAVPRTW